MTRMVNMQNAMPLEEHEIRSVLLGRLRSGIGPDEMIREEFRIERGGSRIDLAVIGSELVGYEIKSDKDTFARFPNQIHAYNRVFDQIHLVCGPILVRMAEDIVPSWWGLQVAKRVDNGDICLETVREAGINPKQDAFSLASLLWKKETIAILASEETKVSPRASSHALWECMTRTLSIEKIKYAVSQTLLTRQDYSAIDVNTM